MHCRDIVPGDIERLKELHNRFFPNDPFIDFLHGFYAAFVVEDNTGIVTAGGIRPIAEIVLVTDMDRDVRDRKTALLNALQLAIHVGNGMKYNELHAFIQNDAWYHRMIRAGFKPTTGKSLVFQL